MSCCHRAVCRHSTVCACIRGCWFVMSRKVMHVRISWLIHTCNDFCLLYTDIIYPSSPLLLYALGIPDERFAFKIISYSFAYSPDVLILLFIKWEWRKPHYMLTEDFISNISLWYMNNMMQSPWGDILCSLPEGLRHEYTVLTLDVAVKEGYMPAVLTPAQLLQYHHNPLWAA